ncbi:peptidoglycan-binding domain-containing protein [Cellulomonas sp. SG140]|uniref:peptidoglycan-binding domain-containing protein n=1 Tax=Cellulomonas sp. SG140 TaxID=2976536 RepID=UPI0021E71102|nr:peptidoglycan-binding domain-containing protein [Cellulomonas sp. SG140]
MARRARWVAAILAVAVLVGAGTWSLGRVGRPPAAAATVVPTATATVTRTDLATTTQVSGTLGYAGHYAVIGQGVGGTVTGLPSPGDVIARGQGVYEVDGHAVPLFYGARPAWRDLAVGVPDGPDVQQLEENLTALGYAGAANLTVDQHFTTATAAAVERWQRATGHTVDGRVAVGAVAYEAGPIRVAAVQAALGGDVRAGSAVLTATSTTSQVLVPVPTVQSYLVHVGDAVTVTLPSGALTNGRVDAVSTAASATADSNGSASPGGGSSREAPVTVPATVTLADPQAVAGLDQTPVTVNITSQAVTGVLAVPISALVALAGGGYGVYLDDAQGRRLVGVVPGLFATTLVQVTSADLHEGDKVEVPVG